MGDPGLVVTDDCVRVMVGGVRRSGACMGACSSLGESGMGESLLAWVVCLEMSASLISSLGASSMTSAGMSMVVEATQCR